jgi:hypothetical protein
MSLQMFKSGEQTRTVFTLEALLLPGWRMCVQLGITIGIHDEIVLEAAIGPEQLIAVLE